MTWLALGMLMSTIAVSGTIINLRRQNRELQERVTALSGELLEARKAASILRMSR